LKILVQFNCGSLGQYFTIMIIWFRFCTCKWQRHKVVNTLVKLKTCSISIWNVGILKIWLAKKSNIGFLHECFETKHITFFKWHINSYCRCLGNMIESIKASGCEYRDRSQKPCRIVMKTMNFFTYVFFLHFKIMLIIPSCVKWLIWKLRNSN
jgi:hypothetical protein